MGQGGKVNIINNTDSRMIKHYEHSYQMDSWSFPDTIEPGRTAGVYVEWDENIFHHSADDGAEVYYHLEKDSKKEVEIHMWNGSKKNFTVAMKGFEGISSEPIPHKWQHDGIMPINVAEKQMDLIRWMTKIDDNTPINKMSIPGTHDTLTYNLPYALEPAYTMSKTQNFDLNQQLQGGCRFFDIRINHELQGRHGSGSAVQAIDCKDGLNEVMEAVKIFLNNNPKEALFMRLKLEGKNSESKPDEMYKENIEKVYEKYKDLFWVNNSKSGFPTLYDIRGKIVILDNLSDHFFSGKGIGYNYDSDIFFIQDDYDDPEKEVKLNKIIENIKQPYDYSKLKINYISANSGKLWPFDWSPKQYANYLNERVINFITTESIDKGYTLGIVIFDFYENDFGSAVISNNSFK